MKRVQEGATKIEGKVSDAAALGGLLASIQKQLPSLPDDAKAALKAMRESFTSTGLADSFSAYFEGQKRGK